MPLLSPAPGDVYCWGTGVDGELGSVTPDKEGVVAFPTRVRGLESIVQVECGDLFTAALSAEGVIYTFGSPAKGRLGRANAADAPVGIVEGLDGFSVSMIAVGQAHTVCIARCGRNGGDSTRVFAFGNPHNSALGSASDGVRAVAVEGLPISDTVFPIVCAAGYQNSACVMSDGSLYTWGDNKYGKSGVSDGVAVITVPTRVDLGGLRAASVELGSVFSAVIGCDGELLTFGYGLSSCLGHGKRVLSLAKPTVVDALKGSTVVQVACTKGMINPVTTGNVAGQEQPHCMCVTSDGRLYTWGTCHKGMLANHSKKILSPPNGDELVPYLVGTPTRDNPHVSGYLGGQCCVQAVASSIHSCVVTASGDAFSFGCGSGGRMGIRKYMEGLHGARSRMKCYVSVPTAIELFQEKDLHVWQASTSRRHMAAVVTKGRQIAPPTPAPITTTFAELPEDPEDEVEEAEEVRRDE